MRACSRQVEKLRSWAASCPERVWPIEGATALGRLLAQQLLAAGEQVLDVQPKLAARVRLLNTGAVNKNDPKKPAATMQPYDGPSTPDRSVRAGAVYRGADSA